MNLTKKFLLLFLFFLTSLFAEPPRAIIFDFGGVIGDVDRDVMYTFLSESLHISRKKIKRDFKGGGLFKALNKPKNFWEKYAGHPLRENWFQSLNQTSDSMLKKTPGMFSLIKEIKNLGIEVSLLSNTGHNQAHFIESNGGYAPFDPIVLSCDVGVCKPKHKIYHYILKELDKQAHQCLFIDNQSENVLAAKKMGMDGIVYKSVKQLIKELQTREIFVSYPQAY